MATSMKMTVFSVVMPYSLVEVYQHFRGAYCLHHQGDGIHVRGIGLRYRNQSVKAGPVGRRVSNRPGQCTTAWSEG
jgi:hypothetical protein